MLTLWLIVTKLNSKHIKPNTDIHVCQLKSTPSMLGLKITHQNLQFRNRAIIRLQHGREFLHQGSLLQSKKKHLSIRSSGTVAIWCYQSVVCSRMRSRYAGYHGDNTWQAFRARFSLAFPSGKFSTTASRCRATRRWYGSRMDLHQPQTISE